MLIMKNVFERCKRCRASESNGGGLCIDHAKKYRDRLQTLEFTAIAGSAR
jgi:hypothetical protein